MRASRSPRWSDGLARRAAHGRTADGLSRRSVLKLAGATVLLGGTLGRSSVAGADQIASCQITNERVAKKEYAACIDSPNKAYNAAADAVQKALAALQNTKSKAKRARLLQTINAGTAAEGRAATDLANCAAGYKNSLLDGLVYCGTPGGGGVVTTSPGGAPPESGGGCPPGTHGCPGSPLCCYGDNACCVCSVGVICCVYGDCRCCP
jgi:hypothetical protein